MKHHSTPDLPPIHPSSEGNRVSYSTEASAAPDEVASAAPNEVAPRHAAAHTGKADLSTPPQSQQLGADTTAPAPHLAPPHPAPLSPAALGKKLSAPTRPITPMKAGEALADDLASHESFGEVDADGTVWVNTPEGRQLVGSYPEVSPEEAVRFFARKYADLYAQLSLLHTRVTTGKLSPTEAQTTRDKLHEEVAQARVVGDLTALTDLLETLTVAIAQRREKAQASRRKAREKTRQAKLRLVEEAESLATSQAWKSTGQRLRDIVEQWKTLPRLDKAGDDQLWKRFSSARATFDRNRRVHFAELDSQRQLAGLEKEKILKQAEKLATSKDWGPTTTVFRQLMQEWKTAGRAARGDDEALWQRMKAAQDTFFTARNAVYAQRDDELNANAAQKESLIAEADKLLPIKDLAATKLALRSVQHRWDAIGDVPRPKRESLEQRLRAVEKAVREADQQQWHQENPQRKARANDVITQLHEAIDKLTRQAQQATEHGQNATAQRLQAELTAKQQWLEQVEKYV